MVGGVLRDYWLPAKIKGDDLPEYEERRESLIQMHQEVYHLYSTYLQGDAQIMQKMKPFWEYFAGHFENEKKIFKAIKKSVGLDKYEDAVGFAFSQKLKENK